MANVILPNGARLYVDHAHPEYSSPEVTNPLDAVRWDKAGELVMLEAIHRLPTIPGVNPVINLYKNNTDNKGASYGAHENYLCSRETPFASLVRHLIPFFVTRQVICGAGRVGLGQDGRTPGFQISQRADFFEVEVGLETTLKRPIVNTRDEPHADADRYRRLHVIIGDANLSEISTYLKVGTTALVLAMIEAGFLADDLAHRPAGARAARRLPRPRPDATPIAARRRAQHHRAGPAGRVPRPRPQVRRRPPRRRRRRPDPRRPGPLGVGAHPAAAGPDAAGPRARLGGQAAAAARATATATASTGTPRACSWSTCSTPTSVRRRGCTTGSCSAGRSSACSATTTPRTAVDTPPADTRAYFRGECLRRYGTSVAAASWDSVIFDVGRESLVRVPMLEPLRGTRKHVGELLDRCPTAADLVEALNAPR